MCVYIYTHTYMYAYIYMYIKGTGSNSGKALSIASAPVFRYTSEPSSVRLLGTEPCEENVHETVQGFEELVAWVFPRHVLRWSG